MTFYEKGSFSRYAFAGFNLDRGGVEKLHGAFAFIVNPAKR